MKRLVSGCTAAMFILGVGCGDGGDGTPADSGVDANVPQSCEFADFIAEVTRLAGQGATDCGDWSIHTDEETGFSCFDGAMASENPARVTLEGRGADSRVYQGWARDADGRVYRVGYDNAINGGGSIPRIGRITVARCADPSRDGVNEENLGNGGGFVSCAELVDRTVFCGPPLR